MEIAQVFEDPYFLGGETDFVDDRQLSSIL
jgi:hypothetical protein